jgi:hypothetical protein
METIDIISPLFGFGATIALKLLYADFSSINGAKAMLVAIGVALIMRIIGPLPAVLAASLASGAFGPEDNKTIIIKYTILLLTAVVLSFFALRVIV